jgi:N-acetylglutamate synthase-like GNAT family acetyltransferase
LAEVVVRPAVDADFAAIKALIHETGINPFRLDWRRFIVVELADGSFAGCGQLKPHSDGTLELASIAVLSAARGQGLARLIIQHLIAQAPRPLYLTCKSQLEPFYTKFGFQAISGRDLPKYFRRISQLAGLINTMRLVRHKLLVMVLK